jgi:hypothetical protein
MMDSIVCLMEVGLLNHTVLLPDGTQTTVPVKDLALYIVSFSQSYANYSVKLVGHSAYAEEFIERIRKEEIRQYSKNIIDIEIIGGNN